MECFGLMAKVKGKWKRDKVVCERLVHYKEIGSQDNVWVFYTIPQTVTCKQLKPTVILHLQETRKRLMKTLSIQFKTSLQTSHFQKVMCLAFIHTFIAKFQILNKFECKDV